MRKLHLIVRLWLRDEANIGEFEKFERAAAGVMAQHGGSIERAFRRKETQESEEPFEVHLVKFPDAEAFAAYRDDDRTLALKEQRERLIARTEIWRGNEINYGF
jgi:uncharacterized protein (DUF1330 family)